MLFSVGLIWVITVSISVVVTQYLLPNVASELHAGSGQLFGMDSYGFHVMASDLSRKILEAGNWVDWEIRPAGQFPVGLYSAIYALTGLNSPLIVSLLNCLLFSFSLAYTIWVNQRLFKISQRASMLSALPCVLFPSMVWVYSQINKDLFSVSGIFIFVSSIVYLTFFRSNRLLVLFVFSCGLLMVSVSRIYLAEILISFFIMYLIFYFYFFSNFSLASKLSLFVVACLAFSLLNGVEFIQDRIGQISEIRSDYELFFPTAFSKIDSDVTFGSISDFIFYIPRALEIWFFHPLPFSVEFASIKQLLQSVIASLEMIFVYLIYIGLCIGFVRGFFFDRSIFLRARPVLIPLSVFIFVGVFYVSAIANLGTLYRMRLGVLMYLVVFLISFGASLRSSSERS